LHLIHTDINSDSRILKEMNCISNSNNMWAVSGIVVQLDEETHGTQENSNLNIYSIDLKNKALEAFVNTIKTHMFFSRVDNKNGV
jgi:hypothetical protein